MYWLQTVQHVDKKLQIPLVSIFNTTHSDILTGINLGKMDEEYQTVQVVELTGL